MEEIKHQVYYCGIQHAQRKLFDELIPLEIGTSYNSYLIKGREKNVLVDTSYPEKGKEFFEGIKGEKIDYVVALHAEQDHSGLLPQLIEKYPDIKIITNEKCKEFIQEFLHVEESRFIVVKDGDTFSLGNKTMKFHFCPFVHWPDTMFMELVEDKMLFTTDFLGAHVTSETQGSIYCVNEILTEHCAKKYYAEIMMPFRSFCAKYLTKIREINPEMILPSHGGIYKNPDFILKLYEKWTADKAENVVLIPYVSMYESTKLLVKRLSQKLEEANIKVKTYEINHMDLGEFVCDLVDANTIVLGASMVLAGPHPSAVNTAYLINALRPKAKNLAIIGSYGWGGNLVGKLEEMLSGLKAQKLPSVLIKGKPKEEDFKLIDELADTIIEKHKEI